ncbi:MAG: DUF6067 family protein [Capnocytophaga sp.]|nr:DUF6067 family protein [Capnocytophaga sp.]
MKLQIIPLLLVPFFAWTQESPEGITHSGLRTGQAPFPTTDYVELPNPVATQSADWQNTKGLASGWGSTDIRYAKEKPALQLANNQKLTAWKGEQVSGLIALSNAGKEADITIEISDLVNISNKKKNISKKNISASFVRYVMTDGFHEGQKQGCGHRKSSDYDSTLVADVIDHKISKIKIPTQTTRPVWVSVQVPQTTDEGVYKGIITIKDNQKTVKKLPLEVEVIDRILPDVKDWNFHLDLWQNPYAVARYFGFKPWSKEHLEQLKIEMKPYVDAGGKVITASIMHQPWGGQTYDYFDSMITWTKKIDGSWKFDFEVFDLWVQLMMDLGVDKQINCYSMVPWKLSFQYFDQATNRMQTTETKPGEPEYDQMWTALLKAFSAHLKEKGWFEKTYISMDERPLETMQKVLEIIKQADPDFRVSFAGDLHEEIEPYLTDFCVPLRMKYDQNTVSERRKKDMVTTYYTCCVEIYPNTYTFSPPAESEWLAWYAATAGLDGYLRWALNSWTLEPLLDSRFVTWAAGDTYIIYPQGRTSVRLERLKHGIQFFEKIKILRDQFTKNGNNEGLRKIDEALQLFDETTLPQIPASEVTAKARQIINSL